MYYSEIRTCDIANGPGIRVSIFVSGCNQHCEGCFNPETWNFKYGKEFTDETMEKLMTHMSNSYIKGITFLGGDPLDNAEDVLPVIKKIKEKYPEKDIWLYTGKIYENITDTTQKEILNYCDVLVDGPFILKQKDITLQFKGSSNQRIIDLNKTRQNKEVTLLDLQKD